MDPDGFWSCRFCGYGLLTEKARDEHIEIYHQAAGRSSFPQTLCYFCGELIPDVLYKHHEQVHSFFMLLEASRYSPVKQRWGKHRYKNFEPGDEAQYVDPNDLDYSASDFPENEIPDDYFGWKTENEHHKSSDVEDNELSNDTCYTDRLRSRTLRQPTVKTTRQEAKHVTWNSSVVHAESASVSDRRPRNTQLVRNSLREWKNRRAALHFEKSIDYDGTVDRNKAVKEAKIPTPPASACVDGFRKPFCMNMKGQRTTLEEIPRRRKFHIRKSICSQGIRSALRVKRKYCGKRKKSVALFREKGNEKHVLRISEDLQPVRTGTSSEDKASLEILTSFDALPEPFAVEPLDLRVEDCRIDSTLKLKQHCVQVPIASLNGADAEVNVAQQCKGSVSTSSGDSGFTDGHSGSVQSSVESISDPVPPSSSPKQSRISIHCHFCEESFRNNVSLFDHVISSHDAHVTSLLLMSFSGKNQVEKLLVRPEKWCPFCGMKTSTSTIFFHHYASTHRARLLRLRHLVADSIELHVQCIVGQANRFSITLISHF